MKLLVVEDEDGIREALIHELCAEGYLADGACDGEEGLDMIFTGVYDLVILDIMLPKRSGLDILHTIRQQKNTIPVILLTARSAIDDKVEGMDCGADDYLTKPFAFPELLARIRMVSRRHYQTVFVDNNLYAGNLILDTGRHELASTVTERRIRLGNKEYQLLEYLMHNKGQILSREQITEKIWGYDSNAEYNNVDVYISFLRKKLQFVFSDIQIRTIRSVGYILQQQEESLP